MPLKLPDRFPDIQIPEIQMPVAIAFASGVCASIFAILLLVYSFNSGPNSGSARGTGPAPAEKQMAEKPAAPEPQRVLGGTQPQDTPCENQTWPYIDQRCLIPAPPKERVATKSQPGDDPLSPNIEVRPEPPVADNKAQNRPAVAPASTDGVASASDRVAATQLVSTPAPTILPGDPAQTPAQPAQTTLAKVDSQAAPAPQAQVSEGTKSRRKANIQFSRERTASVKAGDPNRIVRRWREVEYQGPDGDTRKVIYVKRGTMQRDSYFQTAR